MNLNANLSFLRLKQQYKKPNSKLQTQCFVCPSGRFSTQTGLPSSDNCSIAPIGKYVNDNGILIDCLPGTYQDKTGKTLCKLCQSGKYSNNPGESTCKLCDAGTYGLGGSTTSRCNGYCSKGAYVSTRLDQSK